MTDPIDVTVTPAPMVSVDVAPAAASVAVTPAAVGVSVASPSPVSVAVTNPTIDVQVMAGTLGPQGPIGPQGPTGPTGPAGASAVGRYSQTILADSPRLYWRLGESSGTTAADSSGNGRTGTYVGGPTFGVASLTATDTTNTAVSFTGSATGVVSTETSDPASFTVELWAQMVGSRDGYLANRWGSTGGAQVWYVQLDAFGNVQFQTKSGTGTLSTLLSTTGGIFADLKPHHIVATYSAGSLALYVDGVSRATGTQSGTIATGTATPLTLARGANEGASPTSAILDEFSYYSTALTAAQVLAHYQAGIFYGPAGPAGPAGPTGPAGPAGPSGSATIRTATVTFDPPSCEGAFTITDAAVTESNTVALMAVIPPGDADELEMDRITGNAIAGSGTVSFYLDAHPGPVYGAYTIKYGVM